MPPVVMSFALAFAFAPSPEPEPEPEPKPEIDSAWKQGLRPRVELGPSIGMAMGFMARAEVQVASWRHGDLGVGGLFTTHFWFLSQPGKNEADGVTLRGTDTTIRIAPTVGHTFRFARHRIGLSTWVWPGLALRTQNSSLVDLDHDIDANVRQSVAFFELGAAVSFSVRMGRHFGLSLDAACPVLLGGVPDFGSVVNISPWFVGLTGAWWF